MKLTIRYSAVWLTAVVATVYSAVVCGILSLDAMGRFAKVPHDQPEFLALQEQLAAGPDDAGLKQRVRELDLSLRRAYFRQQHFTKVGAWLLLAGVAVALAAGRWAAALRRDQPAPMPLLPGDDPDERVRYRGLAAVALLALVLAATTWAMTAGHRTVLPEEIDQLPSFPGAGENE